MNHNDDRWDACPEGELARMVGGLRAGKRKQVVNRAAAVSAVALVVLTAVGLTAALLRDGRDGASAAAPIACTRVHELLPAYVAETLGPDMMRRISVHLQHCEKCRRYEQQLHHHAARATPPRPHSTPAQVLLTARR